MMWAPYSTELRVDPGRESGQLGEKIPGNQWRGEGRSLCFFTSSSQILRMHLLHWLLGLFASAQDKGLGERSSCSAERQNTTFLTPILAPCPPQTLAPWGLLARLTWGETQSTSCMPSGQ